MNVNVKSNKNRLLRVPNAHVLLNNMILQSSSLASALLKVKHTISSFPQVKLKVGYWITQINENDTIKRLAVLGL